MFYAEQKILNDSEWKRSSLKLNKGHQWLKILNHIWHNWNPSYQLKKEVKLRSPRGHQRSMASSFKFPYRQKLEMPVVKWEWLLLIILLICFLWQTLQSMFLQGFYQRWYFIINTSLSRVDVNGPCNPVLRLMRLQRQ